jgi:hypothetical protein
MRRARTQSGDGRIAALRPTLQTIRQRAGRGSLPFPESGGHAPAGFGDKTMETLRLPESDRTALLREIERIEL